MHNIKLNRNFSILKKRNMNNLQVNSSFNKDNQVFPLLDKFANNLQHSFNDSEDQIDEDRCYLMEIEQLKRENKFLKKKIQQLKKKHPALSKTNSHKKHSLQLSKLNQGLQPLNNNVSQNYILSFLEQVTRLLQSFGQLFTINFNQTSKQQLTKQHAIFNLLTQNKDRQMQKQLSKLLLAPQQTKFGQLLKIFQIYYQQNKQKQSKIKSRIEILTTQVIQLGKKMANNVRTRQRVKSSKIFTSYDENYRKCEDISLKSSNIKSTCSQLDLSGCRMILGKQKLFDGIF